MICSVTGVKNVWLLSSPPEQKVKQLQVIVTITVAQVFARQRATHSLFAKVSGKPASKTCVWLSAFRFPCFLGVTGKLLTSVVAGLDEAFNFLGYVSFLNQITFKLHRSEETLDTVVSCRSR